MSLQKTYFLAPARHSTPLGVISLGNMIEDPRSPEITINDPGSAAIRALAAKATSIDEINTFTYQAEGTAVKASVMAKVLEGFATIGGGAGLGRSNDVSSIYKIDKMTTLSITPTLDEVKKIFAESSVQESLRSKFFRSSVYMITSIRVVYGAEVFASTVRAAGGFLHLAADLTPSGVPLNIGSTLEAAKSNGQIMSTKVSDKTPFVLAYRLREVSYRAWKVKGQKVIHGDILHAGDSSEEEVEEDLSGLVAAPVVLDAEDDGLPGYLRGVQTFLGVDVDGKDVQLAVASAA